MLKIRDLTLALAAGILAAGIAYAAEYPGGSTYSTPGTPNTPTAPTPPVNDPTTYGPNKSGDAYPGAAAQPDTSTATPDSYGKKTSKHHSRKWNSNDSSSSGSSDTTPTPMH